MHGDNRPNPDSLLEAMKQEASKAQHGKLKIFFGMSAGVGKTYAMLDEARHLLAEGIDVVIGIVETHHRAETEALVDGIPVIPRRKVEYRATTLDEMDVDAILARKPRLVLVDELAHSNAPGSRHPKRYLDVLDLLAAGIDVFTTVNVQHLESRADAVHQITGIPVRETVPDLLIDIANKIELVDIEPEELLKRLTEGKVYTPERAELAAHNFFREGNLTALREMALRITAERVDQQMQDYMQVKQIQGPWKSVERLMVAVSPSPFSERLIRWTRRMAYNLKAHWIAVYVEPLSPLSDAQKAQLSRNLTLAHKLDGEVITTAGEYPVAELLRVARERNVTQIVIGKPASTWFQEALSGGSFVNRLIRDSGDIDIYVVTGDKSSSGEQHLFVPPRLHSGVSKYLIALVVVLGAVAIAYRLLPTIGFQDVALLMLFVILLLANFVGRGPILMAALLSAVMLDYFFIPPRFSLSVATFPDGLVLGLYMLIALVVGNLTARLSSQMKVIHLREERFSALYTMAHEVAHAVTLDDVLRTAVEQVGEIFGAQIAILLPDSAGRLANKPHPVSTLTLDQKELSVAAWAFEHRQPAGRYTDTLPTSPAQYLPLITPGGVAGIIGVQMHHAEPPSVDQEALLQTFVSHIALAVERELLNEATQRATVAAESEKMYATLLDSVSEELQLPLAAIDETTHELLDVCKAERSESQAALVKVLQIALHQLKGAIHDLLDMNRLETGRVKLHVKLHNVTDLVDASLKRVGKELANRDLVVDIAPDLPPVPMDYALMQQVLVNLLHNAVTYTSPGIRVRITARVEGDHLALSVADRGPGIPPQDLDRVFDKFFRMPGSLPGTSGLGLSICKGLVEAHGGTIAAENRPTHGGARFIVRLPLRADSALVMDPVPVLAHVPSTT